MPAQSYRVTIKDASALAILESLKAMHAIDLVLEPVATSPEYVSLRSLRGSVDRQASDAMLRHSQQVRDEWGNKGVG